MLISLPLLSLVLYSTVVAVPVFVPVAELPFPGNATQVSVPAKSEDRTGTSIKLQGNNPTKPSKGPLAGPFMPAGGDIQNKPKCKKFTIVFYSILHNY